MTHGIIISDTHSGHLLGLTPPKYRTRREEIESLMGPFWEWWTKTKKKSYDVMLHIGDAVEGEGRKDTQGHLTTDINEQINIAAEVINSVNAKKHKFVFGTPYHAGTVADYESILAAKFSDESVDTERYLEIDGVRFGIKHVVGKSSVPSGGDIALRNQQIFDILTSDSADERCQIILRGHIHEYREIKSVDQIVCSCPALKLAISKYDKYGRKMTGGSTHVGFIEFTVDKGRVIEFSPKIYKFRSKRVYEQV